MRTGVIAPLAALLSGCAFSPSISEPANIEADGPVIVYRGFIDEVSVNRMEELVESSTLPVRTLRIDSPGGDVEAGLRLGSLVFDHSMDVEVFGRGCHSSCANYVFTAGRRKRIEAGSLVTWHGSAIQTDWNFRPRMYSEAREFAETLQRIRRMQFHFFRTIGVDERVTVVGHDLDCRCVWALSVDDMARFGIDNVEIVGGDYAGSVNTTEFGSAVRFLELPEDLFDRIRPPRQSA